MLVRIVVNPLGSLEDNDWFANKSVTYTQVQFGPKEGDVQEMV